MRLVDLTGKRFDRLLVLKRYPENNNQNKPQWVCRCDCGNETIVTGSCLRSGNTKSCGCLNHEKRLSVPYKHGKTHSKLYYIWTNMKGRCNNKNDKSYRNYGGRGIHVFTDWEDNFIAFYDWAITNGYEEGLSIERIDVNKDYCPDNCKWVSVSEQANNKRDTIYVTLDGKTYRLREICTTYGVKYATALWRYHKGYPIEKILELEGD